MDGNRFGEHAWTFCHPDFLSDRRDALENIKRKGPTQRITQAAQAAAAVTFVQQQQATAMTALPGGSSTVGALTRDIGRLRDDNEDLKGRSRILERNYKDVLVKMVGLQESMVQQDKLMHSIVAYLSDGNSCQQQSRQDRNSEYAPQSTSRLIPKQQQNGYLAQAPHCDQSRYAGTSGHGTSAGWPLTPPSSVYSPEPLASLPSGDPPMQSLAVSPFPGSSSNQSPARYSPGIFPRQISLGPTHDAELAEWRRLGGCGYDSGWGESSGV
ncbi:hypothetical protein BKA70DRAFT_1443575 [Coprinopsis sp. MPI-PUGE-AT-0042]|nr:hypothetical protein BKA70DRAFT_1443575 [Coprinopsis sp. MPI-PUGE-AT-0042]